MIKLKKFKEEYVTLYSPLGWSQGKFNKQQMIDIKNQISNSNVKGYYFICEDGTKFLLDETVLI
jgi:hypothetical protein